jgi:hypothetical protein
MKLSSPEVISVVIIIAYIAFFTRPPPYPLTFLLSNPVGHGLALLGIMYVTAYRSLIVGVFLGLAYIMTVKRVTEYLDEEDQTPTPTPKVAAPQPMAEGVPKPAIKGVVGRLPSKAGSAVTEKPKAMKAPSGMAPKRVEHFASF